MRDRDATRWAWMAALAGWLAVVGEVADSALMMVLAIAASIASGFMWVDQRNERRAAQWVDAVWKDGCAAGRVLERMEKERDGVG